MEKPSKKKEFTLYTVEDLGKKTKSKFICISYLLMNVRLILLS